MTGVQTCALPIYLPHSPGWFGFVGVGHGDRTFRLYPVVADDAGRRIGQHHRRRLARFRPFSRILVGRRNRRENSLPAQDDVAAFPVGHRCRNLRHGRDGRFHGLADIAMALRRLQRLDAVPTFI